MGYKKVVGEEMRHIIVLTLFAVLTFGCQGVAGIAQMMATATPEPGSITGVVSWQTKGTGSKVLVGITVNVFSLDGGRLVANAATDASGNYKILSVPPGKYDVSAFQKASSVGTQIVEKCWVMENVEVRPGQVTQLSLTFDNALETYNTGLGLKLCR